MMRKTLAVAAVLGLGVMAGCSPSSQSPSGGQAASDTSVPRIGVARPALGYVAHFASMPDRGALLAYDRTRTVQHAGAYTAYPVSISEAHALNATAKGDMVVNAPDGRQIRLKYERHVEAPDGNWSWIGRDADGDSAILTFGENAVFGSIPQGAGNTLHITMSGGNSYLVATDRAKLATLGSVPNKRGTDFLTPPKVAGGGAQGGGRGQFAAASAPIASAASATTSPVVDVLVGYTSGYSSAVGGDSVAQTAIANYIAYTNEAYRISGVTMRVRQVDSLKVNYPDNTDNGDALEKMSGFSASSGTAIPTDSRFDALRAKRDEKGADLVVLLRKFNTPENNGCGIAWLIGGNQTGITTDDAPFGYAVVSDGHDQDSSGNDYYCLEGATFAHEMGHNMGQAHNKEDSKDGDGNQSFGLHPYSFGYREASATGFYTIMAYPSGDQQATIPYFANPAVNYTNGHPTGVANESDNVRSMNLSMPVVSGFRQTVVALPGERARNDVNGDGYSDLVFENASLKQAAYWRMKGATRLASATFDFSAGFTIAATADFNGDGLIDLLYQNPTSRQIYMWFSTSTGGFTSKLVGTYPAGWKIVGAGDVDADGFADIFWQNTTTKQFAYWRMQAEKVLGTATTNGIASGYLVVATRDFNADGRTDVLWTNTTTREIYVWTSKTDGKFTSQKSTTYPSGWRIAGTADVNGDKRADILFLNATTKQLAYWKMNAATVTGTATFNNIGAGYDIVATGDYNKDGLDDLLFSNPNVRDLYMWFTSPSGKFASTFVDNYPAGWKVIP